MHSLLILITLLVMENFVGFYRKKPVVIEAYQWDGSEKSISDIYHWSLSSLSPGEDAHIGYVNRSGKVTAYVYTLEGKMSIGINDFVIKGVNGEFYACKPDIFEKTYEEVNDHGSKVSAGVL